GTEFDYDDPARSVELRNSWIKRGAPWFSRANPAPKGWNASEQLADAGLLTYAAVAESASTLLPPVYLHKKDKPLWKRG
ncbi:MAG TPA: hypothetical protein VEU32_17350, partial [Burkholderiales bacterium]|nr:hypothetical protein [Burkholderiales bacterium]